MILDKIALLWHDPGTASVCAAYGGVVGVSLVKTIREQRHSGSEPQVDEPSPLDYVPHADDGWGSGIDRAG